MTLEKTVAMIPTALDSVSGCLQTARVSERDKDKNYLFVQRFGVLRHFISNIKGFKDV